VSASLDRVLSLGAAAFPGVTVDRATLDAHLDKLEGAGPVGDDHAAEIYLACACAQGNAAATRALDEILRRDTARMVGRVDAQQAFVDEVLQLLRVKLLAESPPKILDYAGRSSLQRWLGTAAVRTALNLKRGREDASDDSLESKLGADVGRGPELALAAEKYRGTFEEGLRLAVAQLTDRERALLRMNIVEQMGIDKLSRVYGVGRSTVARWLQAAREKLLDALRGHVRAKHGLTETEAASLAVVVRGDLDVSIARLLEPLSK
jgi:RNA polymerase sigma-70 factor (ECF subfamily)